MERFKVWILNLFLVIILGSQRRCTTFIPIYYSAVAVYVDTLSTHENLSMYLVYYLTQETISAHLYVISSNLPL